MSTFFLPHLPTSRTLPSEDLFATGEIQIFSHPPWTSRLHCSFPLICSFQNVSHPLQTRLVAFAAAAATLTTPSPPPSPPFVRIQVSSCCHLSASFLLSQSVHFGSHPHTYNPRFGQRCHHIIAARLTCLCSLVCPSEHLSQRTVWPISCRHTTLFVLRFPNLAQKNILR